MLYCVCAAVLCVVCNTYVVCCVCVPASFADDVFHIKGYRLGVTPEEIGIELEFDDESDEESARAVTADFVDLFFVRVGDSYRVYRILKEEAVEKGKMDALLQEMKKKYGIPKIQHIETAYTRTNPKKRRYVFSATNRATWKISETQEFIA